MKIIKNNIPFITKKDVLKIFFQTVLIGVLVIISLVWNSTAQIPIASDTNDVVSLTAENDVLLQSWQANSKNITGFEIPIDFDMSRNLAGILSISLKEEINDEDVICSNSLDLATLGNGNAKISLKKESLELGKRYYFELKLSGAEENTVLAMKINSDYGGLMLNDTEISGALAGIIDYEKANNLAWLLRIILIISGITLMIGLCHNKTFEETLGISFGVVFLYIYIWGCFEKLEFGVQSLTVIAMLAALVVPAYAQIKGKKITQLITPGMVGFWCLFLIYFILDRNVVAGKVDDLNHWQLCVRDMWYFDSYAFHPGSTVIAMRYTPAFATIEYFFLYLYGAYREGIILLACHTIGFAVLSVLYSKISWRQCHKIIPVTGLITGLPLLIYQSHYGILYVDAYLGMIGAYLLICYFTEKNSSFNVWRITLGSILLIMTKEMGLAIAGTVYLIIFIDIFLKKKNMKLFLKDIYARKYFSSGCISMIAFLSWQIYVTVAGVKYGFTSKFNNLLTVFEQAEAKTGLPNADNILFASAGNTLAFQKAATQIVEATHQVSEASAADTIKEMIQWILFEKTFVGGSYAELTLIVILLCAALGIAGLYRKWQIPMKQVIVSLLVGTGIYTAFLVICYICLFQEASAIPAARRYMGSYLLLFLITIVGILVVRANEKEESWKQPFVWIISVFVLLNIPDNHPFYTTEENFGIYYSTWENHQTMSEVFRSFADKDERIYYVEYSDSELVPQYNYLTFMNAVVPNSTQGLWSGRKLVAFDNAPFKNYTRKCSSDEWAQILQQEYSYVYLRYVDNYFVENYGKLFEEDSKIVNGGIYSVNITEDGKLLLKKVAFKDLG